MIETLKTKVLDVAQLLSQTHLRLVTAESCTGGGLSYWLTSVPGSSAWFERGFITYSNNAKVEMLQVPVALLEKHGAVSTEIALAMAEGALKMSPADVSIAITGIAGPDGGSAEKPVGLVFIAVGKRDQRALVDQFLFSGDRQAIRLQAMIAALEKVLECC